MFKVAGLWELGYSAPLTELDVWHYMLRSFKCEEWCMSPVSGLFHRGITERESPETFIDENPDYTPVVVDENGETPLQDFVHPEKALYLLGKAGRSMMSTAGAVSVHIETPSEETGLLWPHQAIAIVLYDRQVKEWQ